MSGSSKRLDQMARNPQADWSINDIKTVCADNGFACTAPRGGGSHYKISSPHLNEILTIPARKPILPVYIRAFVGFVRKSRESQN